MANQGRNAVRQRWSWRRLAPYLAPPLIVPVASIIALAAYVVFHGPAH